MVGKKEKFMDMLFFNYITKCFVVFEIKASDFESPNSGQLGTYVVAVNHQMKEEWMSPTIGLLICKDKDEIEAQYALESSSQPLGISSYELSKIIPENLHGSLPSIENAYLFDSHYQLHLSPRVFNGSGIFIILIKTDRLSIECTLGAQR